MSEQMKQNSNYNYTVEITETGLIFAFVYRKDGSRVGQKMSQALFFHNSAYWVERRAKKMHVWAKKFIDMCERQEIIHEQSASLA